MDKPKPERKPSSETVARLADEWTGTPLAEADRKPVAQLLGNLMSDMEKMRDMSIDSAEPATIYHPE